jgi:hypothetical protein
MWVSYSTMLKENWNWQFMWMETATEFAAPTFSPGSTGEPVAPGY